MPKGSKLVLSLHPIHLLNRVFTFLSQICFDSLVPTRPQIKRNDNDVVLSYKKLIKVRFYYKQLRLSLGIIWSYNMQVEAGATSWKFGGVDLHVLERI